MKKYFLFGFLLVFCAQTALAAGTDVLSCNTVTDSSVSRVNMDKVRGAWLTWYNDARKKNGLGSLTYDANLDRTALIWSQTAVKKGTITHKRPGQTKYYDYKRMVSWFKDQGLTFVQVGKSTFVENIGWDYYSCPSSSDDCTDTLIGSIKHTYNFFMSEKGKKYRAHYDSIMNKNYKKIGLGIAVDPVKKRYYLTVHYAVDAVASNTTTKNIAVCDVAGNHKF